MSTSSDRSTSDNSLKLHLDEALKTLKTDLCQQEKLVIQATADREAIARLKQQLQASNDIISEQAVDLDKSKATLTSLKEQYAALEARASIATTVPLCAHEDDTQQLATIRYDLQTKTDALKALQAESVTKVTEAKTLADDNARLRIDLESLQQRKANSCFSQQDVNDRVNAARKEATDIANDFNEQKKIEYDNALKQAYRARDRLEERAISLEAGLKSAKAEATSVTDQQQELLKLQNLVNGHNTEVQNLQVSTFWTIISD